MKGEVWEDIPGLDGYYYISNYGRIKRERRESVNSRGVVITYKEMIIAPRVVRTPNTYVSDLTYQLCAHATIEKKQYCMSIRRLVYYCFVKKFDLADESVLLVSKNGNGLDICPENLHLVDHKEFMDRIIEQKRIVPEFRVIDIHKIGMLAAQKVTSKQVTQYDRKGKKIRTYPSTMEASRQTEILNSQISHTANGLQPTAHGFFWAFGNAKRFDVRTFLAKRRKGYKEKRGTKVTQYDFSGNCIARFLTLTDAANAVGARSYISISSVIGGKSRSALGYFWKKGWGKEKINLNGYKYGPASTAFKLSKKIKQYSIRGKYLRTFSSIRGAARQVGIDTAGIIYALKSEKATAAGFRWKYANKK